MFFDEENFEIDATLTIDKVNFSEIPLLGKLNNPDPKYYIPNNKALLNCILNAIEEQDQDKIKELFGTLSEHTDKLYLDPLIDHIYRLAVINDYTPDDFDRLLDVMPIDINRPIHSIHQGMCRPPEKHKVYLLNIAVDCYNQTLIEYFLEREANIDNVTDCDDLDNGHINETVIEHLVRNIQNDKISLEQSPGDDYILDNLNKKQKMLDILNDKAEKQHSSIRGNVLR